MTEFNSDLQNLGRSNEDSFTTVMTTNQRWSQEETGNIECNLLVITNEITGNGQQLRISSGNANGGSLQRESGKETCLQ